jgi:hypothetical protein
MDSVLWNLRTLDGFVFGAPLAALLLVVLISFWDYPILVTYRLACRGLGLGTQRTPPPGKPLAILVVIPSLLRARDELTSMMSTVESITTNGYAGQILIVLSIDGTSDSPALYDELVQWAAKRPLASKDSLRVTGTPMRRGKPMAIEQAVGYVKELVTLGQYPEFPPVYVSTDADADLGPDALTHIVHRLQRRHPLTGWPTRVVAGALHVRGNQFWRGWRRYFSIEGQLNLQVAREYYVSNVGRYNIRWLPLSGVPGAFYCTWSSLFVTIPHYMGYLRTLKTRHWLGWWLGIAPPKFSATRAAPIPELMAGDTDDTVTAYVAVIARYEHGQFTLEAPRSPLHAFVYMLRGLLVDRAIQFEPLARVFTSSPTTVKSLMRQRKRWNTSRIEVSGRLWPALGYHWTLGFTTACNMFFMARTVLFGIIAYFVVPLVLFRHFMFTGFFVAYAGNVAIASLLTVFALLISGEAQYWRLGLALPLTPVYGFLFNWLPATIGWISDVLLFGNVTGFAPETTLIKGGSVRIALLFRVRRFCSLLVRSIVFGDVPLGRFWWGWRETPWAPSGFEGFTTKKRRGILPPLREWSRRRTDRAR